ncbi:aryl-alcohol-oxidase from pleurotus Eryingii [Mycena sp. CBHHK59/15]|nr:aryl-alcohol-oxidase from pleurotus Eryingii [Mycena sp. CBHHK59/15]
MQRTMFTPTLIILAFFGSLGLCKLYENVADLPGLQYDFVVVGGGTAGNVVANRLTVNANVSVLVLEAGVSKEGVLDSEVPFLLGGLLSSANVYSWNYTTTPQTGLNDRVIGYLRAHLLGGCSAHNGMVYTRGAADDFNRYANLTGDEGWSWDQSFHIPQADRHNTQGQFNPAIHGTDGPISVSLNGFPWSVFEHHVIQTTKELPDEFPFNLDMNSGQPLGVGWLQSTIGGGERSMSATGYLAPKFIQRPNLHVLLHAQVSKLVNVTHQSGKPTFGGVQFLYGTSLFIVKASKEIILSAGAIGTPQILLNSGIGDHNTLKALGIPTVLDLPSTLESITQNATRFSEALEQWNTSRTGPFVDSGVATQLAWLRLAADSPAFDVHADPSPGPPGGIQGAPGHFINFGVGMVSPVSRGSVTLSSSDPFAPPLIDPGLLTSDFDVIALSEGVKLAQRFVSAPVWRNYLGAPTVDLAGMSPAELEANLRNNVMSGSHIVGTAGMSPRAARYGVVDPDLKVKGVVGLSVIDASVLPIVPGAHTQVATYVVAERGADLVKQRWA